jgi:hypothetical protein
MTTRPDETDPEARNPPPPQVEEVGEISPHSKALYEAGKALLVSSIETGRDFCKFMIGVSTGAIPIYIGLLKFVLPEDFAPPAGEGLVALIPAALFLLAAVLFVIGYFPQKSSFSLDLIEEIERERTQAIQWRHRLALAGFGLFCIALVLGLIVSLLAMQKAGTPGTTGTNPETRTAAGSATPPVV